jgi:hypothetical protein
MILVCQVACLRQISNLFHARVDAWGCDPADGWTVHIEGACGEFVVARELGKFWAGALGNLRADDVGRLQVRTSESHTDRLMLHDEDPDDRAFVLVTGIAPRFRIHGWILAREGKRPEWWDDPYGEKYGKERPAYFVPQSELHSIHDLHQT